MSKVPAKTRAGTPLDVVYENRLADEAESGFDPAVLIRRQVGRPSLSSRGGRSNRVDLRVDDDTYNAIRRIAHDSDRRVSEVVREAIRQYLQAS
ncbi:MAG TPA: ribbon-helix-helix protein, CopG family [Jatrophihabitantaceae bacterium]|nr:ribbon-helix-helix protein, CopG family [Jatrophihabitantaceae bacterium]